MKKIMIFTLTAVLLVACGSKKDRNVSEFVSAFINQNKKVILFGKADLKTILDKADYKNVPKFGMLVEEQMKILDKGMNLNTPVYFAVEMNSLNDPKSQTIYTFFDLKNTDSTLAECSKMGQELEKSGDMSYFLDGDVAMGIEGNLAIMQIRQGQTDPKEELLQAFENAYGDLSPEQAKKILDRQADVVLGVKMEGLYQADNPEMSNLSKETQEKLQKMLKESYSETYMDFKNGAVVIESHNYLSDEMKKNMFFKKDPKASILHKLGKGSPKMGFALNIDVKKLQALMEEFSPGIVKTFAESMGGSLQMALLMGGDNALSSMLTGQFGFVLMGEPKADQSMVPDMNIYLGLGEKGKPLADFFAPFLTNGTMQVSITDKAVFCATNPAYADQGKINLPKGTETFGTDGVTGFVDVEHLNIETVTDIEGAAKLINIIKTVSFTYGNEGGKIIITAKDGQENILKQSVNYMLSTLESDIASMNMPE